MNIGSAFFRSQKIKERTFFRHSVHNIAKALVGL